MFSNICTESCPVCQKQYRDEKMVECTKCKRWCCYECVNVSDEVALDEGWLCPLCARLETHVSVNLQESTSNKTKTPAIVSKLSESTFSSTSSRTNNRSPHTYNKTST